MMLIRWLPTQRGSSFGRRSSAPAPSVVLRGCEGAARKINRRSAWRLVDRRHLAARAPKASATATRRPLGRAFLGGVLLRNVFLSDVFLRPGVLRRIFLAAAAALTLGHSAAAEDRITLVAFGDSLVAGFGLPIEDGFAPQLQRWLAENGAPDVDVQNAGVSGDTTSAARARLDWSIGPDADAVLVELGANDALRGVDPKIAKENLAAMIEALQARGLPILLAGMVAPRNWGPDYVAAFDSMYPDLAAEYDVPLYPFFLEGLTEGGSYAQDDGLHPNAAGVAKIVQSIGPDILKLIEEARRAGD